MKINPLGIRAIQSYNQAQSVKKADKKGETFADKLEISSKAKEMQVTSSYESERADKINKLKEDINSGNYKVDARKVAQDMLNYYRR
jgi:negative regulator of flagellin synthesis FlgM